MCPNPIEHLDITSLTRYDRRSEHENYKISVERNSTLNIRSQIFSLKSVEASSERSFIDNFFKHIHTDSTVFSSTIETIFPLSNFKTKHIFGILMALRKFLKLFGWSQAPQFFFCRNAAKGCAPPGGEGNAADSGCFASNYLKL